MQVNSHRLREWKKSYRQKNAARIHAQEKVYRQRNREKKLQATRDWRRRNTERLKAYGRSYNAENRELINARDRRRRETDSNFKIKGNLSCRLRMALRARGLRKTVATQKLLGCELSFLRGYLEARFQQGMSWLNYGEWHIDHMIPCAEFDLRDPAQQRQCFHYSNLRPMWGVDNQRKSNKVPSIHQSELL